MTVTRVYIDGFNLYHGIIRPHRLHWLDLAQFSQRLNLGMPVDKIIYCTAMVSSSPSDPQKAQRQDAYHRALAIACPTVQIVKGQFTRHKKLQSLAGCPNAPTCAVNVWVRTEKGSDVNLAARLLHDAHLGRYDRAIVVSGDSDLAEPIRLVTAEVGKAIWVRNPRNVDCAELAGVATEYSRIRSDVLRASQLPDPVSDGNRSYFRPRKWSVPPQPLTKTTILTAVCPQHQCGKAITTCRYV